MAHWQGDPHSDEPRLAPFYASCEQIVPWLREAVWKRWNKEQSWQKIKAYAEPRGPILLAFIAEEPAGCIALKPLQPDRAIVENEAACEMKRLWGLTGFRGQSVGLALTQSLIAQAREKGYAAMCLDTVPGAMKSANNIYQKRGFEPVERYNINPILGANPSVAVEFFRLGLRDTSELLLQ